MNLAVKYYSQLVEKPTNIPDIWPAQVRELGLSTQLPDNTWNLMTKDEYNAYISAHQAEYDVWLAAHPEIA